MKNLIIVGAGGMGRTLYDNALESKGHGKEFVIKGFLDGDIHALDKFANYPPVLATVDDYEICKDDVFIVSIGGQTRKKCTQEILQKGGEFINIIHETVRLGTNVQLGEGNFIGAYTVIGADSHVGNYNMIQSYTVVGHDSIIGDFNRIDTHVTCVGGTVVKNNTNIHTAAMISHKVVVEDDARVGACSFVIRRVKSGTTVIGNPAKVLKF